MEQIGQEHFQLLIMAFISIDVVALLLILDYVVIMSAILIL